MYSEQEGQEKTEQQAHCTVLPTWRRGLKSYSGQQATKRDSRSLRTQDQQPESKPVLENLGPLCFSLVWREYGQKAPSCKAPLA